jgi:hypothetical protein
MIQIGQKIDNSINYFEFEVYQNDEIKKTRATKSGKSNSPTIRGNGWSYSSIPSTSPPSGPLSWGKPPPAMID